MLVLRRQRGGLLGGGIEVISIAVRVYWAEVQGSWSYFDTEKGSCGEML